MTGLEGFFFEKQKTHGLRTFLVSWQDDFLGEFDTVGRAKAAKKAAATRVAAKATQPHKAVAKSSARKSTMATAKELPAHFAAPEANATKNKDRPVAATASLLAGGNPQIAKADGDDAVQAYIAAKPG